MVRDWVRIFGVVIVGASSGEAFALDLPPGATVIYSSSTAPYEAASLDRPHPPTTGGRSRFDLALPAGAMVIYSARAQPRAVQDEAGILAATPPGVAEAIRISAARHGVSPKIVEAVAWQESRFDHRRVSARGAQGVMQLMPETAAGLGVNVWDMRENIDGGTAYLASLLRRYSGDLRLALAAYNAGPGSVQRYQGVPPYEETQAYVCAILRRIGR